MRTRPILSLFLLGASACITERGPFTNRMAHSATSYLARAARQPVNWQPWGRDAFALAAKLDRPVLLYVGGEACRWCAETDRAIYTDPDIGALINALFVPVRVDRDERPDVAQRYQASVATMAGLRGWPLTVFLTPDGAAFFGGTYFPADDPVTGRGLKQILPEVAKSYRDRRAFIVQHAALVRQLALAGTGVGRGVLQADRIRPEVAAARTALDLAARARGSASVGARRAAARPRQGMGRDRRGTLPGRGTSARQESRPRACRSRRPSGIRGPRGVHHRGRHPLGRDAGRDPRGAAGARR